MLDQFLLLHFKELQIIEKYKMIKGKKFTLYGKVKVFSVDNRNLRKVFIY
jgi:hypothetical protein